MPPFKYVASSMFYPTEPNPYVQSGFVPEQVFPSLHGGQQKRDFRNDFDIKIEPTDVNISADQGLGYFGKKINQDPIDYGTHKLHPIEIVIDESVLEEITILGRQVCEEYGTREIAGFLAGTINRDENGRLWTHVTKSVHEPWVLQTASATEVTITTEHDRFWTNEIKRLGLVHVGMWHTHPGYQPFQSDERFSGADVQATSRTCQNWWSFSMVVDPLMDDRNIVSVGCYKMVSPGSHTDDLISPRTIGWRSAVFGVAKGVGEDE